MDIRPIKYLLLCICAGVISCNTTPQNPEGQQGATLFDLKGYFDEKTKNLGSKTAVKTVSIDENEVTDTVSADRIIADLELFKNYDPNKKAWIDAFVVDTTFGKVPGSMEVYYKAVKDDIPVREINLSKGANNDFNIQVVLKKKNPIYNFEQSLNYKEGIGYSIEKTQKVIGLPEKKYKIEVRFL